MFDLDDDRVIDCAPATAVTDSFTISSQSFGPKIPSAGRTTHRQAVSSVGLPGAWSAFIRGKIHSMRIHNLYSDESGISHFRDLKVEWVNDLPGGRMSARQHATGVIFRQTPGEYDLDWHTVPRRQYIVNLDAAVEITAGDGETRIIGAGEVLLMEDTNGKGHLSKAVAGQVRHSIFITLE